MPRHLRTNASRLARVRARITRLGIAVAVGVGATALVGGVLESSAAHAATTQALWSSNQNGTISAYATTYGNEAPLGTLGTVQSGGCKENTPTTQSGLYCPLFLQTDASGNLWISDQHGYANSGTGTVYDGSLQEFTAADLQSASGSSTPSVTITGMQYTNSSGQNVGSLDEPTGIAFDSSDNLWVANHRNSTVVEYSGTNLTSGAITPTANLYGSGIAGPNDVAFDKYGNLWVVNEGIPGTVSEYSTAQLAALSTTPDPTPNFTITTDTLTPTAGTTVSTLENAKALTFDSSGNLWVVADNSGQSGSGSGATGSGSGMLVEYSATDLPSSTDPTPTDGAALQPAVTITNNTYQVSGDTTDTFDSIDSPNQITFDSSGDLLVDNFYTAQAQTTTAPTPTVGSIAEYTPSELATSGAIRPANGLGGNSTNLAEPVGIVFGDAPTSTSGGGGTGGTGGGGGTGGTGGGTGGTGGGGGGGAVTPPLTPAPPLPAPAPPPTVGPIPDGLSASLVGTPTSELVQSGSPLTVSMQMGSSSFSLLVPSGALPAGTAVSLYPIADATSLVSPSPQHDAYISAFAASWLAPDGTSPKATTPLTMTVVDRQLLVGDVVDALGTSGLTPVAKVTANGQLTFNFEYNEVFVLVQPPRTKRFSPVALHSAKVVAVKLVCTTGTECAGTGNLSVVRKIKEHGKLVTEHVVLATARFTIGANRETAVRFTLTKLGRQSVGRLKAHKPYRTTLTVYTAGGIRMVSRLVVG